MWRERLIAMMHGLTLIGPNPSTYIENGECEPDPREVNHIGGITELVITGVSTVTLCNLATVYTQKLLL